MRTIRLATRRSALAHWQAEEVARLLVGTHPGIEVTFVPIETLGDLRQDRQVWELGGQGIFAKEVQSAVLDGHADAAVHSAKDLTATPVPGLTIAAFPCRADPRDVLVGRRLAELERAAVVATGSVRRRAQLAWLRPDLTFVGLRGNIATRLERVPVAGAIVVARAALDRLGLADRASETLPTEVMLPQVGQGAIAVECREGDAATSELLDAVDDPSVAVALRAERAFLARLGGACDMPVGAHATLERGQINVEGMVAAADGSELRRCSRSGPDSDAEILGAAVAAELLRGGGR